MPFTLAHPAAVLPLHRIPALRMVPLMVGAITPDLPYFLPWRIGRWLVGTHTLAGSVVSDVPSGMIVLLLTVLLRRPLTELLGARARSFVLGALERFGRSPGAWLLAPLSVLVGAWTHLLWDSFTHPSGWMVQRLGVLRAQVSIGGYTGEVCHILQYVSSVLGLAVLAIWYARRAPAVPRAPEPWSARILLALVLVVAVVIGCGWTVHTGHAVQRWPAGWIFFLMLTRSMAWFAVMYLAAGTLRMLGHRPEPQLGRASG